MHCTELVLANERGAGGEVMLVPTNRPPGLNDIGMGAWRSGLIVGESSAAHDETCTLNYVTAQSVCIGAYLVGLGQHLVVQDYVHGISAVRD
jgi:hypothetical protein